MYVSVRIILVQVLAVLGTAIWGHLVIVLCPRRFAVVITKTILKLVQLIVILVPVAFAMVLQVLF